MREEILEAWKGELERPSGAFFGAFARALKIEAGLRDATREAVKLLLPRLD